MTTDLLALIAQAHDTAPPVEVVVPEWGGRKLYFRPLTPAERQAIRRGIDPANEEMLMVSTLIHKALDETGKPVFKNDARTMAELLRSADMAVLVSILSRAGQKPPALDEVGNA